MGRHFAVFLTVLYLSGTCLAVYTVDDSMGFGRSFDGIGGISGGGATSKLLPNYPEKQRNEILDYLFKPNFGASLHLLKVEIGGDSQSTDGTESSHMHESWDENYHRGYEWWLLTEAKKRNPNIITYGLPWAYPGWLGKGSGSPYTYPNVTATYILKWLQGAQREYGIYIDYIGIWNERNYDITYIKTLRSVLDNNGFSRVKIVAADGNWGIAEDVLKDADLAKAIDVLGAHYPGTYSTMEAAKTGKTLWASEDYSTFNDETGGGCWARLLNWNYVNGLMTSTISWNLIASYYHKLPFDRDGLMTAVEPWSGNYVVETPIWMSAHTTQFTLPGYRYLSHNHGVGHLLQGGTFVTLVDPDLKQLTMVIETMTHDHSICIRPPLPPYNVTAQQATFQLAGSFSGITQLNVWYSKLGYNGQQDIMFMKLAPIKVVQGQFTLNLGLDEIYTLTTSTAGQKGAYPDPPPSKQFPSPYVDTFDKYQEFQEAYNFAPQVGSFEIRKSNLSSSGYVNRQTVIQQPIDWCSNSVPITIGGDYNWSDVDVEVSFMIPHDNGTDGVHVAARVSGGGCGSDKAQGLYLAVSLKSQQFVLALDAPLKNVVKSGALPSVLKANTWYNLRLNVQHDSVQGFLNGQSLVKSEVRTPVPNGFVGYGCTTFGYADFQMMGVEELTMFHPRRLPRGQLIVKDGQNLKHNSIL